MNGLVTQYTPDELDPQKLADELEASGNTYAQKKHAFELLNKTQRSFLAQQTNAVRRDHPTMSRREAEDWAIATEEYMAYLIAIVDAEREKNIANASWMALKARFEAMRTLEATRRAELFHRR